MAENKDQDQATKESTPRAEAAKIKMAAAARPPEEVYVDGFFGVLARGGVIKLECYRVLAFDRDENTETRSVTHRLVVPAPALPELARLLQGIADSGRRERGTKDAPDTAVPD